MLGGSLIFGGGCSITLAASFERALHRFAKLPPLTTAVASFGFANGNASIAARDRIPLGKAGLE